MTYFDVQIHNVEFILRASHFGYLEFYKFTFMMVFNLFTIERSIFNFYRKFKTF